MTNSTTFAGLYSDTFALSVRHVCARFHVSDAVAEDIVQGVFMQLWQDNPTLADIENPYTYLRGCLVHAALSHHRRRVRVREQSIDAPLDPGRPDGLKDETWNLKVPVLSVEDQALINIRLQEAAHLIQQLPAPTQLMLHMSIAGYGYDEIHEHLVARYGFTGTVKAVDHRLHRARQQLREVGRIQKAQRRTYRRKTERTAWSQHYAACVVCGTTARRHAAQGRCLRCYDAVWHRTHQGASRPIAAKLQWAKHYPACVTCGTMQIAHCAHGQCKRCYNFALRQQQNAATLPSTTP